MAITQTKTGGINADAVTGAKIADDAVGAEHIEQLDADLSFADSAKAKFGAGNDLEIFHDGNNSNINEGGTGYLAIRSNNIRFENAAANEALLYMTENGSVDLYYDNAKKFETNANGAKISGTGSAFLEINSTDGTVNPMVRMTNGDKTWDAGLRGDTSDSYVIRDHTASASRLTIDTSGNVGIGRTNPSALLHLQSNNTTDYDISTGTTNALLRLGQAGSSDTNHCVGINFEGGSSNGEGYITLVGADASNSNLHFGLRSGGTRKDVMMIDHSGNLGVGTNAPHNADSADGGWHVKPSASAGGPSMAFKRPDTSSTTYALSFINNTTGVGWIHYNNSAATYATASDYRLKENVTALSDGITRLKTLKPSRFNFKVDKDKTVDGFLAHEVTAVPEAITGTKDEVDSDNKPVYQGIDQSKLVPLLTAALQEAIAKIETLETKVAALEAK